MDVNVDSVSPLRFSAVLVRNTGAYARIGGWSYGSEGAVTNKIKATKGRLIDLEPYTDQGKRRFAYVWVKNSGDAGKGWHWNYDLSVKGVIKEINKYKVRLIDLSTYVVDGKRRYSYIGIDNQGVDAKAWWWYVNVTPKFVQQQAQAHGARLIDVERPSAGKMTVIMQRNDESAYSRHVYDYTLTDLLRFQASNGVRITDLERYSKNGKSRYAASLIDNSSAENRRIRSIWRASTMANAPNGTDAWFGIYAKEVKGGVDVGLADDRPYQPLSVLKLIPHLYVMDLLDKDPNLDLLDQPKGITWRALKGKPDEIWCRLTDKGKKTQIYSETLRKTLTRGLGESLNRAHEALLNKYHSATINARIHGMGLTHTNVYPGCKQGAGKKDWTYNRSTLSELGELFEHVDDRTFFPNNWSNVMGEFYGLMANWGTTGIKTVVADEAAKAGQERDRDHVHVQSDDRRQGRRHAPAAVGWHVQRGARVLRPGSVAVPDRPSWTVDGHQDVRRRLLRGQLQGSLQRGHCGQLTEPGLPRLEDEAERDLRPVHGRAVPPRDPQGDRDMA